MTRGKGAVDAVLMRRCTVCRRTGNWQAWVSPQLGHVQLKVEPATRQMVRAEGTISRHVSLSLAGLPLVATALMQSIQ